VRWEAAEPARSGCPINAAVEAFGDSWSLLVLRDVMFGNKRYFRELLAGSEEGIASNILADRLKRLVSAGLLTREDAGPGRRAAYSLTEASIQLVPVFAQLGGWGLHHRPTTKRLRGRPQRQGTPGRGLRRRALTSRTGDDRHRPGLREQGQQDHRIGPGERSGAGGLAGGIHLFGQGNELRPGGGEPVQQRRGLAVLAGRGVEQGEERGLRGPGDVGRTGPRRAGSQAAVGEGEGLLR